jgi:hypothetical protein
MKRILQILFWSIIPAAFIGPGTVTTAASAGARHGYALFSALVFSTVATLVLQEAAGRQRVVRASGETVELGSVDGCEVESGDRLILETHRSTGHPNASALPSLLESSLSRSAVLYSPEAEA